MARLLIPFVLLVLALAVAVLSDRPQPRADFVFINRGDVATLDLQRMSWMQDFRVARILFEGLVQHDVFSHDYAIKPGVAERWEVSEGGRVYTFHLRANARWSNGEPVRAHDFVYAWRRALLPDCASDYYKLFELIDGAKEFYAWRQAALDAFKPGDDAQALWEQTQRKFDQLVGVKALDERTLRVELVRPVPYFLDLCAFAVFYPVYPPLVSQYEKPDPRTGRLDIQSGWTKPGVLVSNGPFELKLWRFKRDLRMEKSEHYWNKDAINIDSISIPSVEDPNAQVLAFTSGAVDWVSDVTPPYRGDMYQDKLAFYREHREQYEALKAQGLDPVEIDRRLPPDPRKNIHAFPAFGTYFYNFNCAPRLVDGRENPFADPRVRRALAMAIDKKRIVEQVRRIGEPVATTLIPPGSLPGYESPKGLEYNPQKARELLAEAGYPGGQGLMTIEILFNRDGGHDVIAQAIARDWQEKLGVKVSLQQQEVKVFRNEVKKHNFIVSRAGWFGDYGDPTTFLGINRTGDGNNDRLYSSERYDSLLEQAEHETDPAARLALLAEAERVLVEEDLPLIPIFHYSQIYLFDPHRVSGISSHPRQSQNMFLVDILGDGKGAERPLALPPRPLGPDGRPISERSMSGMVRTGAAEAAGSGGEAGEPAARATTAEPASEPEVAP